MTPREGAPLIIQTERRVLQAICQGTPEGSVRGPAREILGSYRWREPLHQMVFDILMDLSTESLPLLRELLPGRLTRKGFPDVAWEDFFQPHSLTKAGVERLMEQLRNSGSQAEVSA